MRPDRRSVLAGALAGAVAAPAIAKASSPAALTLFDPDEPSALAFAASQDGRKVAIEGDPIRLARRLFSRGAPERRRRG